MCINFEIVLRDYSPRINNNNFGDKTPRKVNNTHTQVRGWEIAKSERALALYQFVWLLGEGKHPKPISLAMLNRKSVH